MSFSKSQRTIASVSRSVTKQLSDCIASAFALELMNPSSEIYLISGWVSDIPVLANKYGRLRAFIPDETVHDLRLSQFLNMLSDRGTHVHVLVRDLKHNQHFLDRLNPMIETQMRERIHQKTMVCEHFHMSGSMNFTWSGLQNREETFNLFLSRENISEGLIEARRIWGVEV